MKSKLAKQARRDLSAAVQALMPAQRLEAFLAHCRLMAELHHAALARREHAGRERR